MGLAALALYAGALGAEEARVFYKYVDDAGSLHVVQSLDRVPPQYREQIGAIALEGDPQWIQSEAPPPAQRARAAEYEAPERSARRGRGARVVLYYADWCGYCKKARRWLDDNDVRYDLRDIDNPRYGDELEAVSGRKSVPVLSVGGELIRGFNPGAYEKALGG